MNLYDRQRPRNLLRYFPAFLVVMFSVAATATEQNSRVSRDDFAELADTGILLYDSGAPEGLTEFITTFSLRFRELNSQVLTRKLSESEYLLVVAAPSAIESGQINETNLGFLSDTQRSVVSKLKSKSEACFVQELRVSEQNILLAVINSSESSPTNARKCFLLALNTYCRNDRLDFISSSLETLVTNLLSPAKGTCNG